VLTGNSLRDTRARLRSNVTLRRVRLQECYSNVSGVVGQIGIGSGACNIPTDSCEFPTELIWVLRNFKFAFKSPKWVILAPNYVVLLKDNFSTRRIVFEMVKFRGGGSCPLPSAATALCNVICIVGPYI